MTRMTMPSLGFYLLMVWCLSWPGSSFAQDLVTTMPEAISNNAVVLHSDPIAGQTMYTFSGIGAGLSYEDIHRRCYAYHIQSDTWRRLPDLPSGPDRIAAGASVIGDKIYIIGGYEVMSNGNEVSVDKVHVFDIKGDTFLADASPIPVPIDDHIQAVWRDSLIYVVTGWSQNTNVSDVQIYDPSRDEWLVGTPVPRSIQYRVFGGSGDIIGDSIFYAGGASVGNNFPPSPFMRRGIINPSNATEITWEVQRDSNALGYRMAASTSKGRMVWFGGSEVTYNYDADAYNGSGIVHPNRKVRILDVDQGTWTIREDLMPPLMDFRGIGKDPEEYQTFYLMGGIKADQQVSDEVWQISLLPVSNKDISYPSPKIVPNPSNGPMEIILEGAWKMEVIDEAGKVYQKRDHSNRSYIDLSLLPSRTYLLRLSSKKRVLTHPLIRI